MIIKNSPFNAMFTEFQKYGNAIAVQIGSEQLEKTRTFLHNFANKDVSGNTIPYARFKSLVHLSRVIALQEYTRLSRLRADFGYGKGRNLWREARANAKAIVLQIPRATESFVAGVKINNDEHAMI